LGNFCIFKKNKKKSEKKSLFFYNFFLTFWIFVKKMLKIRWEFFGFFQIYFEKPKIPKIMLFCSSVNSKEVRVILLFFSTFFCRISTVNWFFSIRDWFMKKIIFFTFFVHFLAFWMNKFNNLKSDFLSNFSILVSFELIIGRFFLLLMILDPIFHGFERQIVNFLDNYFFILAFFEPNF